MFAEVVVLRNTPQLNRLFTYSVPKDKKNLIGVGTRVLIPFGARELLEAIVFNVFSELTEEPTFKIKAIEDVFSDSIHLNEKDIRMVNWIRDTYLCTYYEAVNLFLPAGIVTHPIKSIKITNQGKFNLETCSKIKKSEKLLLDAIKESPVEIEKLNLPYATSTIKLLIGKLEAKGDICIETRYEAMVKERFEEWLVSNPRLSNAVNEIPNRNLAQKKLANYLLDNKTCKRIEVQDTLKISKNVVDRLVEKGFIDISLKEIKRMPEFMKSNEDKSSVVLNEEQQTVFNQIICAFDKDLNDDVLLHGVTGSGKTEVYAELIKEMMSRGKKSILLLPEIALTPQIVARFCSRFGRERIALIHSKLSLGERYDQWVGIKNGQYDLVIGARSAIFTPLTDIGLIIIDESHELTYRSDKRPKYNTYELAKALSKGYKSLIVSGTATPSIQEYFDAQNGKRTYRVLKGRFNQKPVPKMQIVDMREELMCGNRSILSRALHDAILDRLDRKEQILILLNRKGHSTFVSCRSCGFTLSCPHCDVTLTYFKGAKTVKCNYCSYESFIPKKCPKCESTYFKYFGVGTEKVEEQLKEMFPDATIDRMDQTTTGKKGSIEKIIERVDSEKTDILIGTQMISKGFDFKKVTLVGILSADLMLNLPSYQASERAYQLFNQVAGRAGRGEESGEVILQTYSPEHYAIQPTSFEAFYEEEISFRRAMNYPPFSKMVNLIFMSSDEACCEFYAKKTEVYLSKKIFKKGLQKKVDLYPSNPALLKKIEGNYRYQILLKVSPESHAIVRQWVKTIEDLFASIERCKINVDLDAQFIL